MLNVIISDSAKDSLMRLANMVKAIIKANHIDADVKFLTLNSVNLFNTPADVNSTCLFILEFHMDELELYKKISELCRDSYIIFFSDKVDAIALRASLSGNIRPSGFIEKPVKINELQTAFLDVYACYLNTVQDTAVNVSVGGRIYIVPLKDILYFESIEKKVNLVTQSQCLSYYVSLYSLEAVYSETFVRCHKSFLANLQKIHMAIFDEMLLIMENGAKIPISRTYKNNIKSRLIPKKIPLVRD